MKDFATTERRKWIHGYCAYLTWAQQILATRARLVSPERQALRNITQGA